MNYDRFEMKGLVTRRLVFALVFSLLVHLWLLWPDTSVTQTKDTLSALNATILIAAPPIASGPLPAVAEHTVPPAPIFSKPAVEPASKRDVPAAEGQSTEPPVVISTLPPSATPAPTPATELSPASAESAAGKTSATPAVAPIATPSMPAGASSEIRPVVQGQKTVALDEAGLHRYRLALASQARRFKRYPRQARAMGWSGTADIRLDVASDGRPSDALLAKSSGHTALDRAALAMVDAGARRARLPQSLRGKAFTVMLPVVFNLEDE